MQARPLHLTSHPREVLRSSLAQYVGVAPSGVNIERVFPPTAADPSLGILLHVQVGPELLKGNKLVKAVKVGHLYLHTVQA